VNGFAFFCYPGETVTASVRRAWEEHYGGNIVDSIHEIPIVTPGQIEYIL